MNTMKTTILQIEPYDDVASIRDKVQWCRSERILLVEPKQKRAFPGRLDLHLIARWVKENGASLALVSRSDITREYALSLGIPVFRSIPEAQRGDWSVTSTKLEQRSARRGNAAINELHEGLPGKRAEISLHPKLRMAAIVVSFAALFALILFLIPSATVIVYPRSEEQALTMEIRSSTDYRQVNITGLLPAYESTVTVSGEKTVTSSGIVSIGTDYAEGEVTIKNLTTAGLVLPKGTIVSTAGKSSVRFATTSDVIVPVGGEGVITQVRSLLPGVEGNIEPGQVVILEGNQGSMVEVNNESLFAGGGASNANAPTEQDYSLARSQLLQELEDMALQEALRDSDNERTAIKESLKIKEVVVEEQVNPVGEPSDTLKLKMTAIFTLLAYEPAQLQTLVGEVMDLSLPEGYHVAKDPVEVENLGDLSMVAENEASWRVEVSREIIEDLPINVIISRIRGLSKAKAIGVLNLEVPHIKSAEVVPFVKWWPWLPLLTSRINLVEASINEG